MMVENVADYPILSQLIFLPLAGALLLGLSPFGNIARARWTALGVSLANFLVSLTLLSGFDTGSAEMQYVERMAWIPDIGVTYLLGIDGISLLMVLLTTFTAVVSVLCSWRAITEGVAGFMAALLVMEAGMIGVFVSFDLVLFFLFWEIGLVPMYFLIGIWGGERRLYATIKFFLYTLFGSVFMLVGIVALYQAHGGMTGEYTFDLLKLSAVHYSPVLQMWVFLSFFLGFAIKVPLFPFHTWLPDAHVEAPTAGSVILAGVLLKMGTYAFLRFSLPLLPEASLAASPWILTLSVVGIVYGAFLAMAQTDIKKLVAYSSVSHLGFVMAGIFALNRQGIDGAVLQMVNHGISTGGLFLIIGMIYERRHTRLLADFGGIAKVMPVYAAFVMLIVLSSIGLPGTNGFVGEVLILLGLFRESIPLAACATTGVILGAVYMLRMYQQFMFGEITIEANRNLSDLSFREVATLLPVAGLILWIGIYPAPLLKIASAGTERLSTMVRDRQEMVAERPPAHEQDMPSAEDRMKMAAPEPATNSRPAEMLAAVSSIGQGVIPGEGDAAGSVPPGTGKLPLLKGLDLKAGASGPKEARDE